MRQYEDKCFENFDWIIEQLEQENKNQIEKWGIQVHSGFEWLTYIAEELGSLAKAIGEYEYRGGLREEVISEAFQVATLAIKVAEMYKLKKDIESTKLLFIGEDWLPTSANINALPEPVRKFIHDIETNVDPQGLVRENVLIKDTCKALVIKLEEKKEKK